MSPGTNSLVLLACAVLERVGLHDVLRRTHADLCAVLRALGLELGVHALAVALPHKPEDCPPGACVKEDMRVQ